MAKISENEENASNKIESLKIFAWNIHGLNNLKLNLHSRLFSENHVIILSETWTNDLSEFYLKDYIYSNFSRHKKHDLAIRSSGGIVMFLHRDLKKGVDVAFKSREGAIWSRFRSGFFGLNHDLYLCCIYFPPDTSNHAIEDCFGLIEADIASFPEDSLILFAGDPNARCGTLRDYTIDQLSCDGVSAPCANYLDTSVILELNNNGKLHRSSSDPCINNHGKSLIDFCKTSSLLIFNGRCPNDLTGEITFPKANNRKCKKQRGSTKPKNA